MSGAVGASLGIINSASSVLPLDIFGKGFVIHSIRRPMRALESACRLANALQVMEQDNRAAHRAEGYWRGSPPGK